VTPRSALSPVVPGRSPQAARVRSARGLSLVFVFALQVGTGIVGVGLPAPANAEADVGLRAPSCELASLSSSAVFLPPRARFFEGRLVLVDFWASWCPTCEYAFPFLNELARDYRDQGLEVIAVNLDADPRDALAFLAGRAVDFEIAHDPSGRCPRAFGLVGMPSSYLIDAEGRIRAVTRGFRKGEARSLRARIDTLLVKSPVGESDPSLARVASPPPP
jgi:thiol-disulfide isomerase/thioredoxin